MFTATLLTIISREPRILLFKAVEACAVILAHILWLVSRLLLTKVSPLDIAEERVCLNLIDAIGTKTIIRIAHQFLKHVLCLG